MTRETQSVSSVPKCEVCGTSWDYLNGNYIEQICECRPTRTQKPHSIRPDRLREMADHINPDYPASAEDLLFIADQLAGLVEQYEGLRSELELSSQEIDHRDDEILGLQEQLEAAHAEAARSEAYAEERDLVAQKFEEELEAKNALLAQLTDYQVAGFHEHHARLSVYRTSFPAKESHDDKGYSEESPASSRDCECDRRGLSRDDECIYDEPCTDTSPGYDTPATRHDGARTGAVSSPASNPKEDA